MTESVAWLNPKNYNCRSATCAHFCARLCILNTLYKLNVARVFSLWNFITCTRACFFFGSFQTFPFFFFFFLSLKRADHLSRMKSRAFFRAREKFVKKRLVSFGSNTINFTDANYATLWAWWRKKNRKKMEWISNSETNSYEINLSDHETRLILARSSFSTNFPDHANTLMLIIIARFFLESNTTISRSYRKRERERKHLHPAVTSVYVTSVTREQAPHGCGTQWCEFSKDVLQYARRRGGEEEEEEARSLIWINKGAIIRGAFGDSFTRHIFASRFNPSLQRAPPVPVLWKRRRSSVNDRPWSSGSMD